mgnify:CR=1 FL=1
MLFSFEGAILQKNDPVTIAKWNHLNSYRTQKLSTSAATIVGPAPAKIARCRVFFFIYMDIIMDQFEKEQLAISICRNYKDKIFIYKGAVKDWINQIGSFFHLFIDENCLRSDTECSFFVFTGQDASILLTAEAFLDFF